MEFWDKVKILTNSLSILFLPLIVGIIANVYNKGIKERELQGKFVELSVQILKDAPSKENSNIRKWAVGVINEYSGVKLDTFTINDLIKNIPLTTEGNSGRILKMETKDGNSPIQVQIHFDKMFLVAYTIQLWGESRNPLMHIAGNNANNNDTTITLPISNKIDKKFLIDLHYTVSKLNSSDSIYYSTIQIFQNNQQIGEKIISEHLTRDVYSFGFNGVIDLLN